MKLIRIFGLILLLFWLILNTVYLVLANEGEIIFEQAAYVHINYLDNSIIPPFLGTGIANRFLVYGDYVPLYLSQPDKFKPYHLPDPPYKNIFNSPQEVIAAANDVNHPFHTQGVNFRPLAEVLLAMEEKENYLKNNLFQQDITSALNQMNVFSYDFGVTPPSSIWRYDLNNSLQTPYRPEYLRQLDNTYIAPVNQWNSVTYNPSENYFEELDELLNPVPDMSFLEDVFARSGPLGDMAEALADIATPYTFLPAIFMLGMDIFLQSQKEIGFLYPTTTGYEISPCPESGMVMIKKGEQQMIYNITGGEEGTITNLPSGDFGTFFVEGINYFSGGIRPTASFSSDNQLAGGRIQYNNLPLPYQNKDYSLNLESHVGMSQPNLELGDTVICKIKGSGSMVMLPFKIGVWFQCEQGQTGNIKSKTTIGVRFKNDPKYYTYDLVDCALQNINSNSAFAANQDSIMMWNGVAIINAEEYGQSEIEEIYLALNSSAKKLSGLNRMNCYTSLSFSPYFLKPIISLPQDVETFIEEETHFMTELLNRPAGAQINISWELPSGSEPQKGYEVTHTFKQTGTYDCKLIVDPEYQPRLPAVAVTDPNELFWNTPAGKIIFPFKVRVLPALDLKVDWRLPPYVALNTRNHPEQEVYPGRKTNFTFYLTNIGTKDFRSSEYQNVPLKLSLSIDRNYNHYFEPEEKIWEKEIQDLSANSSQFFNVEEIFSLDRRDNDPNDNTIFYWPGLHDCQLQVSVLTEEENKGNNIIRKAIEFISSPELDSTLPDFTLENVNTTIDQYKNLNLSFDISEKGGAKAIIDKWNEYNQENPYYPQWGPITYEFWLRDGHGFNLLLSSGEVEKISYQGSISIQIKPLNLEYIPAGDYDLYLGINLGVNGSDIISEKEWRNNHAFMGWVTLTDERTLPWFTKGGDRGHTGWKNLNLKPPLITDWVMETDGIPVDIVCNSESFYVLSTSGIITKYNSSGVEQYSIGGFDGTPLKSSTLLLIYPDTEQEKLLAFSEDNRLVLLDTQTGNKIWTSNNIFSDTTYDSKHRIKKYSRSLDYDGYYLLAGWPIALYYFTSGLSQPELRWQKDKEGSGEVFLLGNYILAGPYLYSLNGEEQDNFKWMDNHTIRYLQNIFTDRHKYNYLSGQLNQLEEMQNPGALFSAKIMAGRQMQCFDYQGNQQWTLPKNIEQEYYPASSSQKISIYIEPESIINLGNDNQACAYAINQSYQLLAVDLISGQPLWYREFVEVPSSIKNIKENLPEYLFSQFDLNNAFHQTPLNRSEGFAVNITCLVLFQNSLLVGTVGQKIYRLIPSNLSHLVIQGYIPSVFYGPTTLKVMVQAVNEEGTNIPLEDKFTVIGDTIYNQSPKYYKIEEDISLSIKLSDSEELVVDYPEPPSIGSNHFDFVDIQSLFPRFSVPLEIDNIQSRIRISQKDAPAGEIFTLALNSEAEVVYKPKKEKNSVTLYYSHYGKEEASQVVYEHSYNLGVSSRNTQQIAEDYEFINLKINLPQEIRNQNFSVKLNGELYGHWSLDNQSLVISCLPAFIEQGRNNLSILILKVR
ncbi:MAG: hypothetical protein Kow00103_11840 [Candidatus Caldatribacteriota bacterium]